MLGCVTTAVSACHDTRGSCVVGTRSLRLPLGGGCGPLRDSSCFFEAIARWFAVLCLPSVQLSYRRLIEPLCSLLGIEAVTTAGGHVCMLRLTISLAGASFCRVCSLFDVLSFTRLISSLSNNTVVKAMSKMKFCLACVRVPDHRSGLFGAYHSPLWLVRTL